MGALERPAFAVHCFEHGLLDYTHVHQGAMPLLAASNCENVMH